MPEKHPSGKDLQEMLMSGTLHIRVNFDCPSFTDEQVKAIGRFFKDCGISSKKCEWVNGGAHKIVAEMPGYEIQIYCGILGESVDVVLEDEKKAMSCCRDVNVIYEKLREMIRRRSALTGMGFEERKHSKGMQDKMLMPEDADVDGEAYTKPVVTHHTETLMGELEKVYQALA